MLFKDRRFGIIKIEMDATKINELYKMFYDIRFNVVEATSHPIENVIEYKGTSSLFDEVKEGKMIPNYKIIFKDYKYILDKKEY
jgi:hypothetical protein